ncbi:MAG: DUF4261 domain-containing protein [Acidobacteriota bacterium]
MKILRALRGKDGRPNREPALFVAMVALAEPRPPDPKRLTACLREHWPDQPGFTAFECHDEVLACEIGPAAGAVGLIPAPIPAVDIQAACEASLLWPEAAHVLVKHTAHLICTVGGTVEKKVAAINLTKLVAAVTQSTSALGVYWGAANLVHSPAAFFGQAREMTEEFLPLYLWILFGLSGAVGKVTLRTQGMASLGFMELEIVESDRDPPDIVEFAFNIAHYLLDRGPVLADGDTFGLSEEQKVLVCHAASIVDPAEKVYRLKY